MSRPCVHKWQIDSKNVGTCSLCGEVRQFPYEKGQEPVVLKAGRPRNPSSTEKTGPQHQIRKRHRYLEDHRGEITADLLSLGRVATRAKWGIPTSTMHGLQQKWLTEDQRAQIPVPLTQANPAADPGAARSGNGRLPNFPEFSATWDTSIQIKWLEVYEILAAQVHKA